MKQSSTRRSIIYLCTAAAIAALYVVLTEIANAAGLASGVIQFRISEVLCIFALFTPAAVPGMTIGCLISNIITGCVIYDIIFGTLATLIGMIGMRLLAKLPAKFFWITPLPYFLANTIIVPFVIRYAYAAEESIPFLMLTVGVGELVCAWIGGLILYPVIRKTPISKLLKAE